MRFLEKNLEDIIFETDNELLRNRDLWIFGNKKRQVNIGNYGIADIITWQIERDDCPVNCNNYSEQKCKECNKSWKYEKINNLKIQIIELKQSEINIGAFLQAVRYLKGIKRYFEYRNFYHKVSFEIILIGEKINTNTGFDFIPDLFEINCDDYQSDESIRFYTYKYEIDGLKFNRESGYYLKDENFKK